MPVALQKIFPILDTLQNYTSSDLKGDVSAGLTVGIMLIPQGMAYALIAGLPPQYGLYAALVPLIIYAFLGTSRHLAVGPVALIALLVASAVAPLANSPEEYIALSILLALMVGSIQMLFGFMRLGFLVNLLSHPVLSGFISAAAIFIGLNQLHHLFGLSSVSGGLHELLYGIALQIKDVNLITLGIGIAAIATIIFTKKIAPAIPGAVLVVVLGILAIFISNWDARGVAIVGEIPAGLPSFVMPDISLSIMMTLFPMALAIALVAYMEAIAVAKAIQRKSKSYVIDPNKELVALGAANLGGAFFQSFPGTGSFSRTAVNYQSGGKSTLSSVFSVIVVAVALLFLTPVFYYLPNAVLAAIIITAVYGLIEFDQFKKLWKLKHYDRYMFLATFAGTLFIGIKEGILLGVTLSVIMLVYRSARPNHSILGRIPDTTVYRNIDRYDTEQDQDCLVFRFDAPLHFANAEYFRDQVNDIIRMNPERRNIVLDLNGVNDIDSSGLEELLELKKDLNENEIFVHLAEVKAPVRDLIKKNSSSLENWKFYMTVQDAVDAVHRNNSSDAQDQLKIHLDTR